MTQRSHRLIGLGVLLGALGGANALAEPGSPGKPSSPPGHAGSHASGLSGHAGGHSDKKAERAEAKSDQAGSMPGSRGAEGKSGKSDEMPKSADAKPMGGGDSPGMGMGRGGFRSEMRALREGIKDGSIKKEDIKGRLEKLRESQSERKKQHQQLVHQRWGSSLLATSQAKQELRDHARRSAMLDRALLLAQTETKLPDRAKVIERIEKLIEREDARHDRVMTQMKSTPSSAEAKAAPAQNPGPSNNDKPMQGGDR